MPKNPDLSYINSNGKLVSGSAALLHYVYTKKGGVQNYNDEVGTAYHMLRNSFVRTPTLSMKGLLKRLRKVALK